MLSGIFKSLGQGINPTSGRDLPSSSVVFTGEGQRVINALCEEFTAKEVLKAKKDKRSLTPLQANELQQKNLANGRPARSNFPWSEQELSQLEHLHNEGMTIGEIASECERSKLAVAIQLEKLCLVSIEEVEALR
jgi:hypothetical protein